MYIPHITYWYILLNVLLWYWYVVRIVHQQQGSLQKSSVVDVKEES